jgi:hypothetical protein
MSRWRQDWRGVWKATSQVSNYFVCYTFYVCLATSCLRNVKTLCLLPRELVLMDSKLNIWLSVQDTVFSSTPMVSRTCDLSGNCNLSGVMAVTLWGNISLWIRRKIWKIQLACIPGQRVYRLFFATMLALYKYTQSEACTTNACNKILSVSDRVNWYNSEWISAEGIISVLVIREL